MPNFDVSLDVRNGPANGAEGYTDTTTSNGTTYCFKYSGGTDGHGGVDEPTGAGSGTITVQIGTDGRYEISNVEFSGDIDNQLSWRQGPTAKTAVITDTDTSSGNGYYRVIGRDTTANCTFPCDPPIKHEPN
jgi:hypothetical protein